MAVVDFCTNGGIKKGELFTVSAKTNAGKSVIYSDNHGSYDSRRFEGSGVSDSRIVRRMLKDHLIGQLSSAIDKISDIDSLDDMIRGLDVGTADAFLLSLKEKSDFNG